jgi:hypothetical protein
LMFDPSTMSLFVMIALFSLRRVFGRLWFLECGFFA